MEELPVRDWLEISIDTDMGVLGIGAFGFILKGKFDNREVAIKRVPLEDHDLNEEETMLTMDHPNIVKLFHCESANNFRYYALELCVASLDHLFLKTDDEKKYNGPMPRHIEVFQHLALGLEHIHSKDLVHGDIRPENVLISVGSADPDEITIKWADFGLNRNVNVQGTALNGEARGKNAFLAPELLKLSGTKNHGTAKGDVFAQGLVFSTLFLNGEHLYGSMENGNEILDNIINGNPINMQKIDSEILGLNEDALFNKMLEDDPSKRTTSTQVVNQLKTIKNQIAGKGKELLELCGRDSHLDLTGKIQNLIQFGVNLNAKDDKGRNALHLLCQNYSSLKLTDAIKLLIENGIDAKATTNDGSNATHYLCRYNSTRNLNDAIKIFTELGMDLTTINNDGRSASYYLRNKDKREMEIWFDRDAVLGLGGYGVVLKGKFGRREVAVKRVPHKDHDLNEEEAMLKLDHPNIVKLFHCESDDNFRYYALELCVASLDHLFLKSDDEKKYNGPMPHHIEFFQHLALGLEHIHSKDLVHGDIRPENVLISVGSAGPDKITIKWADFGLNRNVDVQGTAIKGEARGKNAWLAPELLKLSGTKNHGTAKGDVFAQGLVFGTLFLNGEHLYGSMENGNEILDNIINGNPINMQKIDSEILGLYEDALFNKMLEDDPSKRTTSTQVVNQLKTIKNQIAGKGKELLELCGRDSQLDLTGKIQNLIQFGVNLNAKDDEGRDALYFLCQNYSSLKLTDAIKLLIENGIEAKSTTNDGSNALYYLGRYNPNPNFNDAFKISTELGMDLTTINNDGWSASYYLRNKDKRGMKIWFDRHAVLGLGGYGVVLKGKFGGREVAVKRVELRHVEREQRNTNYEIENAVLKLDHPNIVKLFHCESDDNFRYYAMELCDASLNHLFLHPDDPRKYNGPMPCHIEAFQQLASGLEHIHSRMLIQRNIKPSKILILVTSVEVTLKWCDFSKNIFDFERELYSLSEVSRTRTWCAPEVLEKLTNEGIAVMLNRQRDLWGTARGKSEVFVLGLIFGYLFLKGEHLYGSSEKEIHKNIIKKKPVNLQKIDSNLREMYENNLFRKMLEHDPRKRITSKGVVEQLKSIKEKLARKEEELRQLCASNFQVNLANKIQDLSRYGIDMNAKGNDGWNALHFSCRYNSDVNLIKSITLLKELGVDVNAKNNKGWNALHIVCQFNSTSNETGAMKHLIDLGIDVDATDNDGCSALHHLCENNSGPHLVDAIQLLILRGIHVNVKVKKDGSNALHYLCRYNSSSNLITAMKCLIESGIDVKEKSDDGTNALHYLCRYNSSSNLTDVIKLLIESGIDAKEKDNEGSNAAHHLSRYSKSSNLRNAIDILIVNGIDKNEKDKSGRTISDYLNEYTLEKKQLEIECDSKIILGRGAYGSVFQGKLGNRLVAIKRVELYRANDNEEDVMLQLDHPNIVKLLCRESNKDFCYYALELCVASLDKLFLNSDNPTKYNGPMPCLIDVLLQLASGLEYIHSKGFTHRDIKPGNILISGGQDNNDVITIKWADFGLSRPVNERGTFTPSKITGTKTWSAPEIVRLYMKGEECRGDVKSDVFALALVFGWLFLYGKNLYGSNQYEIENNIIRKKPINMQKIDSKLRDLYGKNLLTKMLKDDRKKRISSADVVKQLESIKGKITGDEDKNWFNEVPEKSKEI